MTIDEIQFPINLKRFLSQIEIRIIKEAMRLSGQNCDKAAQLLGVKRTTLVEKRKRYGLRLNPCYTIPESSRNPYA